MNFMNTYWIFGETGRVDFDWENKVEITNDNLESARHFKELTLPNKSFFFWFIHIEFETWKQNKFD